METILDFIVTIGNCILFLVLCGTIFTIVAVFTLLPTRKELICDQAVNSAFVSIFGTQSYTVQKLHGTIDDSFIQYVIKSKKYPKISFSAKLYVRKNCGEIINGDCIYVFTFNNRGCIKPIGIAYRN